MAFRAISSFDLFIQAYLGLILTFPVIETTENFTLDDVSQIVFKAQDDYFLQRFIFLLVCFLPPDNINLYKQFRVYANTNKTHFVRLAVEQLPNDKKIILLNAWRKLEQYNDLISSISFVEANRYKLIDTLKGAIIFLQNNPAIEIEQLLAIQKKTQSGFSNFMDSLSNTSEDDVQSTENVPYPTL